MSKKQFTSVRIVVIVHPLQARRVRKQLRTATEWWGQTPNCRTNMGDF